MGKPLHANRNYVRGFGPAAGRLHRLIVATAAASIWVTVAQLVILLGVIKPHEYRFVLVWTTAALLSTVAIKLARLAVGLWHTVRIGSPG
jgi:hypothetical protein